LSRTGSRTRYGDRWALTPHFVSGARGMFTLAPPGEAPCKRRDGTKDVGEYPTRARAGETIGRGSRQCPALASRCPLPRFAPSHAVSAIDRGGSFGLFYRVPMVEL